MSGVVVARRLSVVAPQPSRAVLYVRVSAIMGREGDDFLSPDLQLRAMRDLARRRDLTEVEIVEDLDVSGRSLSRAGVDRILELARTRQIDVVALYDLSRLGRNTGESLRTIAELRDLGVSVVSTVENIDDSPEGQFQLTTFLGLAQLYSDQVGRRWSQVHKYNAERGVLHGRIPLGYIRTAPRTIEVDPAIGPAVTDTFTRYARGESVRSLARRLAVFRGRPVHPSTITDILSSEVYLGRVRLNGTTTDGLHPPLVDQATWKRCQRRLDKPRPSRTIGSPYSLAGLVYCSECERALWRRTNRGREYLQCRTHFELRAPCAGIGTPRVDQVEQAVLIGIRGEVVELAADPARRVSRGERRAAGNSDIRRLTREIASTEQLLREAGRRALVEPGYELAVKDLRVELDALRERVAAAQDIVELPLATAALSTGRRLLDRWPRMTPPERNLALRSLGIRVTVRRAARRGEPMSERVTIAW